LLLSWGCSYVFAADLQLDKRADNALGSFSAPAGPCKIQVDISPRGGFRVLSLPSKLGKRRRVSDVVSYMFTDDGGVVYSVSPIYGVPGIYLFDCSSRVVRRLVAAKNRDPAYPKGADYFELVGARGTKVLFYYAPDIDHVDVNKVRTSQNLYETDLQGRTFRKVQ